jgi:thioredoxin 1
MGSLRTLLCKEPPRVPVEVLTDANIVTVITESMVPLLVHFWAPWVPAGKMLVSVIDSLKDDYRGLVRFGIVNADENKDTLSFFGVDAVPILLLFVGNRAVHQIRGAVPASHIREALDKFLGA